MIEKVIRMVNNQNYVNHFKKVLHDVCGLNLKNLIIVNDYSGDDYFSDDMSILTINFKVQNSTLVDHIREDSTLSMVFNYGDYSLNDSEYFSLDDFNETIVSTVILYDTLISHTINHTCESVINLIPIIMGNSVIIGRKRNDYINSNNYHADSLLCGNTNEYIVTIINTLYAKIIINNNSTLSNHDHAVLLLSLLTMGRMKDLSLRLIQLCDKNDNFDMFFLLLQISEKYVHFSRQDSYYYWDHAHFSHNVMIHALLDYENKVFVNTIIADDNYYIPWLLAHDHVNLDNINSIITHVRTVVNNHHDSFSSDTEYSSAQWDIFRNHYPITLKSPLIISIYLWLINVMNYQDTALINNDNKEISINPIITRVLYDGKMSVFFPSLSTSHISLLRMSKHFHKNHIDFPLTNKSINMALDKNTMDTSNHYQQLVFNILILVSIIKKHPDHSIHIHDFDEILSTIVHNAINNDYVGYTRKLLISTLMIPSIHYSSNLNALKSLLTVQPHVYNHMVDHYGDNLGDDKISNMVLSVNDALVDDNDYYSNIINNSLSFDHFFNILINDQ